MVGIAFPKLKIERKQIYQHKSASSDSVKILCINGKKHDKREV